MTAVALTLCTAALLLWPAPRSIRLYVWAQLIYALPIWFAAYMFGIGPVYRVVYCLFTGFVLLTVLNIVWESARRPKAWAIAIVLSVSFFHLFATRIPRQLSLDDWIILIEGTILLMAGLIQGFCAPSEARGYRVIALILSGLWLSQSLFDVGYLIHCPAWEGAVSWHVPAWTEIAAFLLLAWRLKTASLYYTEQTSVRPEAIL